MAALAYSSRKDLIMMIRNRLIDNCPITVNGVKRYYEIYGNSEGAIKGKTKRKKPALQKDWRAFQPKYL
jgi:hypothetical protein